MTAVELVKFHVDPITARFCWLLRALAPVAERILIRLAFSTAQSDATGSRASVQTMLLPTVNGRLNVWAELGDAAALGLHDLYYAGNTAKTGDSKPTWEVPVKQIARIIEQNSDGWDRQLAFSFRPKACSIRVILATIAHAQDSCEEEDFLDELEMPTTTPTCSSSTFSNEYTVPAELLSSAAELSEPRIPRPKAFCRPPPNLPALLKQLAFMRDLRKPDNARSYSASSTKDDRQERTAFCEVRVERDGRLELSAWSTSHFSATYDHLAIADRQPHEMARCMVLIDPLSRVIRSLQLISESAVLSSGMQAVLAVLDEHAVVLYVQMPFETITFYIPAFVL